MESIGNSLESNFLINQMQSNALTKKMEGETAHSKEVIGQSLNTFGDILKEQIHQINNLQVQANDAAKTYAVGGDVELHNVIMAAEKADLALQLATQIRNKLISAYQEISRMNI